MEIQRPMLAYTIEDVNELKFPLFVSVKLDGIRCTVQNGTLISRSGKPIQSPVAQAMFGRTEFEGLDGELIFGDMFAKDVFQKTTSAVMSKTWPEELDKSLLSFHVFDKMSDKPYNERFNEVLFVLKGKNEFDNIPAFVLVQTRVNNAKELLILEQSFLNKGAEGVMCRSIDGKYKNGRSTKKDGIIGKLKRFSDSEALILGFEEKMHNANELKVDSLGYAERSTNKQNMVGMDTLGSIVCKDMKTGVTFSIGSGFNDALRKEIWNNRDSYMGKIVKYKYFAIGTVDAPRFPVFLGTIEFVGIRHENDL